jgi:hypothetical protein
VTDADYNITGYTSLYFAAQLINNEWAQHRSGIHRMFPSSVDLKDAEGNALVTSYALHRPDGSWSLLLVNRDESESHSVRVSFDNLASKQTGFSGPVRVVTFGSDQYVWKSEGRSSHADPDGPADGTTITANPQTTFNLPRATITVLRGNVKSLGN